MRDDALQRQIMALFGVPAAQISPLSGGMIGQVYQASLIDGRVIVVKTNANPAASLATEGFMLNYLAQNSRLPVPEVFHADKHWLIMAHIPTKGPINKSAQEHAADLLADLHRVTAPQYGLEQDTLIGALPQPNPFSTSWVSFFRDHRLRYMSHVAYQVGNLPSELYSRLERFAGRIERWLSEPSRPALLHGDIWGGNVLAHNGKIAAFIDPAIYYGHPEIELAFISLFNTFGDTFYKHYHAQNPIAAGFFEERCAIYNLYPLLVHVRLFGGSYVSSVEQTLRRFGF